MNPLTAAAAIAVILASVTAVASITGILPKFNSASDPSATAPVVAATSSTSQPEATPTASEPAAAPVTQQAAPTKKPASRKPAQVAASAPTQDSAPSPEPVQSDQPVAPPPPPPCYACGVVETARIIQQQAPPSGLGAAAGAVLGGVLGHQVGGGNGKSLATIAGAIGGGLAGNAVEKNRNTSNAYEVVVRMDDGSHQRFVLKEQRWKPGDAVQIVNGGIVARN